MPGGRPQGQGCPDRTSPKAWKRLAKTRQATQPLSRLPAFSLPRVAPAGPQRGPRRPSSLGAAPLGKWGSLEAIPRILTFRDLRGGDPYNMPSDTVAGTLHIGIAVWIFATAFVSCVGKCSPDGSRALP